MADEKKERKPARERRTHVVRVPMTPDEVRELEAIARDEHDSRAGVIRRAVRDLHEASIIRRMA